MKNYKLILHSFILIFCILYYGCSEDNNPTSSTQQNEIKMNGWVKQTSGVTNVLNSVYFVSENTGWICGEVGTILYTTNGGINWQSQNSGTTFNLFSILPLDTNTVYAFGLVGKFLKTTNSGNAWNSMSQFTNYTLYSSKNAGSRIYTVGDLGRIYFSFDNGVNWSLQSAPQLIPITDIDFLTSGLGIAVGYDVFTTGFIFITYNWGVNWSDISYTLNKQITSTVFIDNGSVLVGTLDGDIYKCAYTEANWSRNCYSDACINSISTINSTVYAINAKMSVLKSNDLGESWVVKTNSSQKELKDVFFINDMTGWCIGAEGLIFKTTTGGE